jgi:hypothetical protein
MWAYHLQTKAGNSPAQRRSRMTYYQAKIPGNWYGKRGKNQTVRALRGNGFSDGKFVEAVSSIAKWNVSGIFAPACRCRRLGVFARFCALFEF